MMHSSSVIQQHSIHILERFKFFTRPGSPSLPISHYLTLTPSFLSFLSHSFSILLYLSTDSFALSLYFLPIWTFISIFFSIPLSALSHTQTLSHSLEFSHRTWTNVFYNNIHLSVQFELSLRDISLSPYSSPSLVIPVILYGLIMIWINIS